MLSKKIKAIAILTGFLTMSAFSGVVKADMITTRLGGADRYETNIAISNEFVKDNPTDTAILASSIDYPDSLSAAPLTGIYNAPILITEKNKLTTSIENQIKKLGIKKVIIVGGTGVVSEKVNSRLKELGISTERLAGADRYETSMKIANKAAEYKFKKSGFLNATIVATSNYTDTLSLAAVSVYMEAPIILVRKEDKKISDVKGLQDYIDKYASDLDALKEHGYATYVLARGITNDLYFSLPESTPLGGIDGELKDNNYVNNILINLSAQSMLNFENIVIANGENFPDALGGGALAGKLKAPIVFTGNAKEEEGIKTSATWLEPYKITKNVYYIGGTAVVPDGAESAFK